MKNRSDTLIDNPTGVSGAVWLLGATLAVSATLVPEIGRTQETCYRDDVGRVVTRRRPGYVEVPCPTERSQSQQRVEPEVTPATPAEETGRAARPQIIERSPPANNAPFPRPQIEDFCTAIALPDRWRVVDALGGTRDPRALREQCQATELSAQSFEPESLIDPYNRNILKADRPVHGDWFFNLGIISDTVYELREVPTPVGGISTNDPGGLNVFGASDQWVGVQSVAAEFVYYKGNTVFKPPDWEFRLTPVLNYNYVELEELQGVNADAAEGRTRSDFHVGIQAAFVDKHLRNVSDRYDFDSFRLGIQPFSSDFRGFLFQDNQLGARLFGTRANNKWQYNIAYFRRLEKDTNSGLNDLGEDLRKDDVFVANVYRQDFPVLGFTSQATLLYNRNRESDDFYYNKNDFIERPASIGREAPRDYDVAYLGYNGDGHFGRLNLTTSLYYAIGEEKPSVFVNEETDISALFAAAELSMDFDWIRPRVSLLYASGDDDPFDDKATGFDAVFENPQFAGADTSYWIRQAVALVGGGRVALSGRNGVLNSLRSSKEEGQSNFTNPGTLLAGLGVDLDLMPTLRLSLNANTIYMVDSEVVEVARNQSDIDEHIGYDVSASLTWRPLMSQNIVVRASYATLIAGDGFEALYPDENPGYLLLNAILSY